MNNYANVIINHLSVGMERDVFVDDEAHLLMYIPPTSPPPDLSDGAVVTPKVPEQSQPSSSNMGYILIGVGCLVSSALVLLAVRLMKRRRKERMASSAVADAPDYDSHYEPSFPSSEDERAVNSENYCIEVEISDTETVAMSVDKEGQVEKVPEKTNKIAKTGSQGTAATEDDCATISTQESGVTLYLDMKRVGSDVSALTWNGPSQLSDDPTSNLGKNLASLGMGAIQEDLEEDEEELEYDFNTEDDIKASALRHPPRTAASLEKDSLCYSSSNGSRKVV